MKNKQFNNCLLNGILVFVLVCCISVVAYQALIAIDGRSCYKRIAKNLGVEPDFFAIREAYFEQVDEDLSPGMSRNEVIGVLEKIGKVVPIQLGDMANGGSLERTRIRICFFYENDVSFLIRYTPDDKLMSIELDVID